MSYIDSTQEAIEQVEARLNRIFSEVRHEKVESIGQKPNFDDIPRTTVNRGSEMIYKYIDDYGYIKEYNPNKYNIIYDYE